MATAAAPSIAVSISLEVFGGWGEREASTTDEPPQRAGVAPPATTAAWNAVFLRNLSELSELPFGIGVDRFGFADRTLRAAADGGTAMAREKSTGSKRGFAAMSPEKQREIAAKGGRASHGGGRRPGSSTNRGS